MIEDDDLTPEQISKLKEWLADGKLWISVEAAIKVIESYLNTTTGHAQKLLADARASREVRFANDDLAKDPRRDYMFRKDDLDGWLGRNHPRQNIQGKSGGGALLTRAKLALDALYPGGVPDPAIVRNKMLCARVEEWLKRKSMAAPGKDTILRAAGRKQARPKRQSTV